MPFELFEGVKPKEMRHFLGHPSSHDRFVNSLTGIQITPFGVGFEPRQKDFELITSNRLTASLLNLLVDLAKEFGY